MKLRKGEFIERVRPQYAAGPGWAKAPLWIHLNFNGERSVECLQPEEQSAEVHTLFRVCAAAHDAMLAAVTRQLAGKKK